jgi:RNA polymerase-interacting CarD/CdnL/TRCF family regulator
MKSSVNFQPVKSTSQSHNLRLREFDYVRKDLKDENYSSGSTIKHSIIIDDLKKIVKEKTGRTAQEKAVFIKEGVFLIKAEHSNAQLQKFAEAFAEKFNVKLLELHVHRDEGHWEDPENKRGWKPNLHAHIVTENINRNTGKSVSWKREDMIKIQDFFAEHLEMERGVQSEKKHIDSKTWKLQKIESKINAKIDVLSDIDERVEELCNDIEKTTAEGLKKTNEGYVLLLNKILSDLARKTQTKEQINLFVAEHENYPLLKKLFVLKETGTKLAEKINAEKEESIKRKGRRM